MNTRKPENGAMYLTSNIEQAQFVMRFTLCSVRHALCVVVGFLPREMLALGNSFMADLLRRIPQPVHISEINPNFINEMEK